MAGISLFLRYPWIVDRLRGITHSHEVAYTQACSVERAPCGRVIVSSVGTRGACAVAGTRGLVFHFSTGGRNVHEQGRTLGIFFAVGVELSFEAVANSVE